LNSLELATFAAMIRILGIAILVALTHIVNAQTTGNPFDLKYRPAKPAVKETPVQPVGKPDTLLKSQPSGTTGSSQPVTKPALPDTLRPNAAMLSADTLAPGESGNPFERSPGTDSTTSLIPSTVDTASKAVAEKIIPRAPSKPASRGFQIFFMLLSLLFLIFIVNVERSFVRDLWRVISNENYSSLHHRNQRNTMRQILLMMGYTVFIIQAGLFIYHALRIYQYRVSLLDNIWAAIALVLGIYIIRHAVIRYLRWLFNNEKELTLFGFDISIFNTMVGLVLLPINILIIFGPENIHKPLVIIGIIAIGGAYLMRQLRWLLTARQLIAHSLFLFFVYLCAVEILPLWAVSKLFW